jgi:hypothetical protein
MSTEALWWIALGAGLVVALVAVALLHVLLSTVRRIDHTAGQIWQTGRELAANTATTWQIGKLSAQVEGLAEEASRQQPLPRSGAKGRKRT